MTQAMETHYTRRRERAGAKHGRRRFYQQEPPQAGDDRTPGRRRRAGEALPGADRAPRHSRGAARGGARVQALHQARGDPPPDAVHRAHHAQIRRRPHRGAIGRDRGALEAPDRAPAPGRALARRDDERSGGDRALRAGDSRGRCAPPARAHRQGQEREGRRPAAEEFPRALPRAERPPPGPRETATVSDSPHDAVRVGLVATSDRASQGVYRDEGIPALEQWLAGALENPLEFERRLIPAERAVIESTLKELVDARRCHLVITTGGTGPAARDVTPEATLAVADREMPGFGEQMRRIRPGLLPPTIPSRQGAPIPRAAPHLHPPR